jgi:hypothetical protein
MANDVVVIFDNRSNGTFCRGVAAARARNIAGGEGGRALALEDAIIIAKGCVRRTGSTGGFIGGIVNIASSDERKGVGAAFKGEIKDVSVDGWEASQNGFVII